MYKKLFSIAVVSAAALFASSTAYAHHRGRHHTHRVRVATTVTPTIVAGNPANCASAPLGITGSTTLFDSGKSGTVTAPGVAITVTTSDGITFDFSASFSGALASDKILAVFAKGGNQGGNLYDYRPNGVTSDTGLHPPLTGNNGNGGFASISHLLFCYGTVATTTPVVPGPNNPSNPTTPGVTVTAPSLQGTSPTTQHKAQSKKKVKAKKVKSRSRRARQKAAFTG
jgi:hypothetical protein